MNDKLCQEIADEYRKLAEEGRLAELDGFVQHGTCSSLRHSLGVAYVSLYLHDKYNLKGDRSALLRAALLHDYFLYDWHTVDVSRRRFHGFTHGALAAKNAARDYVLTDKEINSIMRHMFPLTPVPPKHVEGGVIVVADKICAMYEIYCKIPYGHLYKMATGKEE